MRKLLACILSLTMMLLMTACGSTEGTSSAAQKTADTEESTPASASVDSAKQNADGKTSKRILVAYFSRAGENYNVGYIEKGNTHIMADMIAEAVGANTFEIKTVKPYPEDYKECTEVAKQELAEDARPSLAGKVENWEDYDTVFLGYPIWWSYPPMAIYTFLESYDFSGKMVIPFCTSAGNVLTGKESDLPQYGKGMVMREGLGLEGKRVQENPDSAKADVIKWLKGLGFVSNSKDRITQP
ncbi:MAG: flavodoxin [Selenomonadaceae bacterium]|nr:flavodoxin [Selenomonadaceae bacterium]